MSGGYYSDTYIFNTNDVGVNEIIVEPVSNSAADVISVVTSTNFTNMIDSSFDEIESVVLASNQTAWFTGLQLTGEIISLSGNSGSETVIVNIGAGQQFTSRLTNSDANIESVQYIGNSGDENIAGGEMDEIITGAEGNDSLSGGAGNDTFVFSTYSTNGLDRITLSLTGSSVDDVLDFSANSFINSGTAQVGFITETDYSTTVTSNLADDNVLILKNVYFTNATALKDSTTVFANSATSGSPGGNVIIIYASSISTDARVAYATLSTTGDVNYAIDIAVLVGVTVANAFDYFDDGNFIL